MRYLNFSRRIIFTKLSVVLNKLAMQKTNTQKKKKKKRKEIKFPFKSQIS